MQESAGHRGAEVEETREARSQTPREPRVQARRLREVTQTSATPEGEWAELSLRERKSHQRPQKREILAPCCLFLPVTA